MVWNPGAGVPRGSHHNRYPHTHHAPPASLRNLPHTHSTSALKAGLLAGCCSHGNSIPGCPTQYFPPPPSSTLNPYHLHSQNKCSITSSKWTPLPPPPAFLHPCFLPLLIQWEATSWEGEGWREWRWQEAELRWVKGEGRNRGSHGSAPLHSAVVPKVWASVLTPRAISSPCMGLYLSWMKVQSTDRLPMNPKTHTGAQHQSPGATSSPQPQSCSPF